MTSNCRLSKLKDSIIDNRVENPKVCGQAMPDFLFNN